VYGSAGHDRCCCCPFGRSFHRRSNRHLHHRQVGYAGERAISAFSDGNTDASFENICAVARGNPCLGASTVRASKAGFEPASPWMRSIRHLHHQRWLSSARRAANQNSSAAQMRRQLRTPWSSPLPLVSGSSPRSLRQAPRAWARAKAARTPGSGSPVPACAGTSSSEPCVGQQKTLRKLWAWEGP
jgi:hypothetical protein